MMLSFGPRSAAVRSAALPPRQYCMRAGVDEQTVGGAETTKYEGRLQSSLCNAKLHRLDFGLRTSDFALRTSEESDS